MYSKLAVLGGFGGDIGFGLHIDQDDKGSLSEKEATFTVQIRFDYGKYWI